MAEDLEIMSVDISAPREVTDPRDSEPRYVYDLAIRLRNNSAVATFHVVDSIRYLAVDTTAKTLTIELMEREPAPTSVVRRKDIRHVVVAPGQETTVLLTIPQTISEISSLHRGELGEPTIRRTLISEMRRLAVVVAYAPEPFYSLPAEQPSARFRRLSSWARLLRLTTDVRFEK